MRLWRLLSALAALAALAVAWLALAPPPGAKGAPHRYRIVTEQIDISQIPPYGENREGAEEPGLERQDQVVAAPSRRRFGRPLVFFLVLLAALAAGGIYLSTAVVVHIDNLVTPGTNLDLPRPIKNVLPGLAATPADGSPGTTRINILVLGVDRRPHHDQVTDGPPNTDSIHLLSIDPVSKTATAISFPRDLFIEVPDPEKSGQFLEARINTAYKLGVEAKYPGGGPAFAKRAFEYTFHIPVDYYAVVDWVAFADVIEALGGIWITVPEPLKNVEGFNPHDGNAFAITIPAGTQYMDSITALAYARFRSDDENDFGRIRRQQEVMRSAADEALRHGWLTQSKPLYDRFRGAVDTDMTALKAAGLTPLLRSIGIDRVKMVSAAGEKHEAVRPVITPRGEDVLVPVWDVMSGIIREAIDDRALRLEGATVTVVNASGVHGQDQRAVSYLHRFMLPPDRITAAESQSTAAPTPSAAATGVATTATLPIAEKTTVTYTGSANETAGRVASWLGLPPSRVARVESAIGAPSAVTVMLGRDLRLPDDERFSRYATR